MIDYKNLEFAHSLKKEVEQVENAILYFENGFKNNVKFPFDVNYILNVLRDKRLQLKNIFMRNYGIDIDYVEEKEFPNVAKDSDQHIDKGV